MRSVKFITFLAVLLAISGCKTTSREVPNNLSDDALARQYLNILKCVNNNYASQNIISNNRIIVLEGIEYSLNVCDGKIASYGDALADRALIDNGWVGYTQNIPYDAKIIVRRQITDFLVSAYTKGSNT